MRVAQRCVAAECGAEIESGFAQALQAIARWRIDDAALELLDETGDVFARFVR